MKARSHRLPANADHGSQGEKEEHVAEKKQGHDPIALRELPARVIGRPTNPSLHTQYDETYDSQTHEQGRDNLPC